MPGGNDETMSSRVDPGSARLRPLGDGFVEVVVLQQGALGLDVGDPARVEGDPDVVDRFVGLKDDRGDVGVSLRDLEADKRGTCQAAGGGVGGDAAAVLDTGVA
jgi:hypothetical protein